MADATTRTLRIVWTSMLGAQVLYAALGFGVFKPPPQPGNPLLPILACLALVAAVLAVILRGRLATFGTPPTDPPLPLAARTPAPVIPWALDESLGGFGFLLMMTGHRPIEWL